MLSIFVNFDNSVVNFDFLDLKGEKEFIDFCECVLLESPKISLLVCWEWDSMEELLFKLSTKSTNRRFSLDEL